MKSGIGGAVGVGATRGPETASGALGGMNGDDPPTRRLSTLSSLWKAASGSSEAVLVPNERPWGNHDGTADRSAGRAGVSGERSGVGAGGRSGAGAGGRSGVGGVEDRAGADDSGCSSSRGADGGSRDIGFPSSPDDGDRPGGGGSSLREAVGDGGDTCGSLFGAGSPAGGAGGDQGGGEVRAWSRVPGVGAPGGGVVGGVRPVGGGLPGGGSTVTLLGVPNTLSGVTPSC